MLRQIISASLVAGVLVSVSASAGAGPDRGWTHPGNEKSQWHHGKRLGHDKHKTSAQLGPRPFFLVADMDDSPLKEKLQSCENGPFYKTDFSIGHRGAPMQFPEHTKESYQAAAQMGAGILECDVTFTKDKELVCRHSQCDLHTTTNIVATELGAKCSSPFQPAVFDGAGNKISSASARCCTSDITLAEFKTLEGKMDASNADATTPEEYLGGTAAWRTDLYADRGTLLTHKESIELFKELGVKMTPELKSASVSMPFDGFSQQDYAQKLINEYKEAGVDPRDVYAQSFDFNDVLYWINNEPAFGEQAVALDGRYSAGLDFRDPSTWVPGMDELVAQGVKIIAPPIWMLIDLENGEIVPSSYALAAKAAGLEIIAWSFERDGPLANGGGWYNQSVNGQNPAYSGQQGVINNDGDMMDVLDVLAQDVGVIGIFSDWPATVTYYANCMDL